MKVKLRAFPVVYYTVKCKKHDCLVEVRHTESKDRTDMFVFGGRITALKCEVGGSAQHSNCVDNWELTVSAGGDAVVCS